MLLYFVVRVIPVKSGHGHFGQNQNKKIISRLKIVYINNILFIYTIFRTFSLQKTNLTEMTMTEFDRIFVVVKKSAFTLLITKIVVNVIYIYSAIYSTVSCHFRTALLNKLPPFLNKQPKNVLSLQRQPMKVLREPRRRHLLRPRAVTIDDRRRSSIKTQKVALSGSWQSIKLSFTQLTQMGKLKNLKKLEKLKPYALWLNLQPKRLLALTSNDRRE